MLPFVRLRWVRLTAAIAAIAMIAFVAFANHRILTHHTARIYRDVNALPARGVGLVLGANPLTANGGPNVHFNYRMDAAAALYRAGKVRHLLVSGDNHRADYDEPTQMKRALMARGVPAAAITCDYAGFRTLDSITRAKIVFGITSCTIITQDYHATRALEIARAKRLDALGFCTRDVPAFHAFRTEIREVLARTAAVLDLYVWRREPRFAGPYEPIVLAHR